MPSAATNMLDISQLPVDKRLELIDFYHFLLSRSIAGKKTGDTRLLPAAFDTPIRVHGYMKVSRDEIYEEI